MKQKCIDCKYAIKDLNIFVLANCYSCRSIKGLEIIKDRKYLNRFNKCIKFERKEEENGNQGK